MKKLHALVALLLCVVCLPLNALAGQTPYYTETEDHNGRLVYSQTGYIPDGTFAEFNDKQLKRPADIFIDENDIMYIADEGNDRVIMCTLDGELIRIFGEDDVNSAVGLYVRNGKCYVADTKEEAVFIYDVNTGDLVSKLEHPGTVLYGVKEDFKPLKVAVDKAENIYVISKGNTNGIAQFSADGTFLGFFGANDTTLSLGEMIKRLTYTQEQLDQLKSVVPPTPTSLDMDARGLLYTVTTGVEGVKRLNMSGVNIMDPHRGVYTNGIDVAVTAEETIFVVNEVGYIVEYTRDGRILFHFGGTDGDRTRTGLFINSVAIDVDSKGNVYVLDREKALVQRLAITDYASLVHQALDLYQEGLYADSREPWEEVLALNSLFDYAQMGLGRAYYKLEMYDEALAASRLGGDKEGYSDSYWEIRNVWLQDNLLTLAGVLIGLWLLRKLWKLLKSKCAPVKALANGMARIGDAKLLRELRFMMYFPKNPADAYWGVRFEGKVSVLSSTILYAVMFAIYMIYKYSCGFLFKTIEDGRYEVMSDLILVLGGFTLFLVACNLICSIRDGEGTAKQMYCGLAYALMPYIVLKPINYLLSFVLTFNEAFIVTMIDIVAIVGCFVLIVMMVKTLHNYTFRETFAALLLTVFTMLMIIIAMVIAAALVAQLWEFLSAVWKEASFFYES